MKSLILSIALLASAHAAAETEAVFNHRPVERRVSDMLERGKVAELADEAFDAMFTRAVAELREHHASALAAEIEGQWISVYKGALSNHGGPFGDVGDHFPIEYSTWILAQYAKIESVLGVEIMEATHLRDIWTLCYGLATVFEPDQGSEWCAEQLANFPDDTCEKEYERAFAGTHWVPGAADDPGATAYRHGGVAGIASYWTTYGVCLAATYGTGAIGVCGLAATAVQIGVERFVAPPAAARIWENRN